MKFGNLFCKRFTIQPKINFKHSIAVDAANVRGNTESMIEAFLLTRCVDFSHATDLNALRDDILALFQRIAGNDAAIYYRQYVQDIN